VPMDGRMVRQLAADPTPKEPAMTTPDTPETEPEEAQPVETPPVEDPPAGSPSPWDNPAPEEPDEPSTA